MLLVLVVTIGGKGLDVCSMVGLVPCNQRRSGCFFLICGGYSK